MAVAGWWEMPGPGRFVQRLAQTVRDGRNIVLVVPPWMPTGIYEAVRRTTGWEGRLWRLLDLVSVLPDQSSPDLVLPLARPSPQSSAGIVGRLLDAPELSSTVFWVEGCDSSALPMWFSLLRTYADRCRSAPAAERPVFCVVVRAHSRDKLPQDDVALSVVKCRGMSDRVDILAYLAHNVSGIEEPAIIGDTRIAVAAQLAGSDPELASRLVCLPLERLLEPAEFLRDYGTSHGCDSGAGKSEEEMLEWTDESGGSYRMHSAAVALGSAPSEVRRRVWAGQVGVLFPFLEERRVELLERLEPHLHLPFQTVFGQITDIRDFELSHLLHSVLQNGRKPASLLPVLDNLVKMRRRLAHLEPVDAELLLKTVRSCKVL